MTLSITAGVPGLSVLFLFGSRARGDAHAESDWDFAYLGTAALDVDGLLARLVFATGSDRVDLADLSRASGLLRYRVAKDGCVLVEHEPGAADRFRLEAIDFWCDAGPGIEQEYERGKPLYPVREIGTTDRTGTTVTFTPDLTIFSSGTGSAPASEARITRSSSVTT